MEVDMAAIVMGTTASSHSEVKAMTAAASKEDAQ